MRCYRVTWNHYDDHYIVAAETEAEAIEEALRTHRRITGRPFARYTASADDVTNAPGPEARSAEASS